MVDSRCLKAYPSTMDENTLKEAAAAIGRRASERRQELGLSVNDVAMAMKRTYQCIHGMEKEGTTHLRVILEWAEALKMKPEELAFGESRRSAKTEQAVELINAKTLLAESAQLIDGRQGKRKKLVDSIREFLG